MRACAPSGTPAASALPPLASNPEFCRFREDRLPAGMVRNGNVQKDSVLTFTRASNGRVTAAADGVELATGTAMLAVNIYFDAALLRAIALASCNCFEIATAMCTSITKTRVSTAYM
jgi:hypothetical protein